jgi:hypothetical protein
MVLEQYPPPPPRARARATPIPMAQAVTLAAAVTCRTPLAPVSSAPWMV